MLSTQLHARKQQLVAARTLVDAQAALEESFFLGLRMNRGVSLVQMKQQFGAPTVDSYAIAIGELVDAGLLSQEDERLMLTSRGRLLSNEVFERFLGEQPVHH